MRRDPSSHPTAQTSSIEESEEVGEVEEWSNEEEWVMVELQNEIEVTWWFCGDWSLLEERKFSFSLTSTNKQTSPDNEFHKYTLELFIEIS